MKKIKFKNKKSHLTPHTSKGITLIALVITIIVMLILAAVSITMAVNGGLFEYARNASEETVDARDQELTLGSGIVGGKTIDQWVSGDTTPTKNEDGFYYDTPYSAILFGNTKFSFVFKDTGKLEVYQNGIPNLDLWDTAYEFVNGKIRVNNVDCSLSEDGKTVTVPGAFMSAMTQGVVTADTDYTTTFEEYHDIYYDIIYYNTIGMGGDSVMFSTDATYLVGWINLPVTLLEFATSISGHVLTRKWSYKSFIYGWKESLFRRWEYDSYF